MENTRLNNHSFFISSEHTYTDSKNCDFFKSQQETFLINNKRRGSYSSSSPFGKPFCLRAVNSEDNFFNNKLYGLSNKPSSSFFHLNRNSLNLHIDELEIVFSLNSKFDIIGLSETRILSNLNYKNPTPEAFHGGAALFISNHLNSCRRSDLESLLYSP